MKNKSLAFVTGLVAIIALASCKKPVSQLALYVPKDASAVFIIEPKAIMDKIASSGITIDSLANLFTKDDDEHALRWNDIKNSGVDLDKPIYFFSKQTNSMQAGNTKSAGLIAQVKDAKKLEDFFKRQRVGSNALPGKDYKYIALGEEFIAGWSDDVLIISSVTSGTYSPGKYSTGEGTLSQQQLTTLFTQKESASIASDGAFRDLLAKTGDIHFYMNAAAHLASVPMMGMTNANSLLEGSYTEGTINFEKGKIVAAAETHTSKALSDILEKYPSREIRKDLVTNYPGVVSGFGIIAFDPKVLGEILRFLGFDKMADGFTTQMGFTTNDIVNAFSGDIAFMVSPAAPKAKEEIAPEFKIERVHHGKFLLNIAIGDKAAFDRIISGLTDKQILSKNGDYYQLGTAGGHGFVIKATGTNLIIASGGEVVEAYQSPGEKAAVQPDIEKQISNKSMAVYFDIAQLLNKDTSTGIAINDGNRAFSGTRKAALTTFKNFIATSSKSDGKTVHGSLELNFINTSENSLASFAKFLVIAKEEELKRKKDPTMLPPLSSMPGIDSSGEEDNDNE